MHEQRQLVLWVPDWPVLAHIRAERITDAAPVALIDKGTVFACSATARADGVRRGMRQREAQTRCPGLRVLPYDPSHDARAFEPILATLDAVLPGLHPIRPGTVATPARGPARYYGGERAAALTILGAIARHDLGTPRVGIADGLFAAEHAARLGSVPGNSAPGNSASGGSIPGGYGTAAGTAPVTIVPPGDSGRFLAPLPVALLEAPELSGLLPRLGVRTLGEFAALPADDVADRFGPAGARLHALASGVDTRATPHRIPPHDIDATVDFEPALDRIDQIAFGVRAAAGDFIAELLEHRLVCTALRVELAGERGEVSERVWLHPRSFTAAEVVDRVRWTLAGSSSLGTSGGSSSLGTSSGASTTAAAITADVRAGVGELQSAVARVRISPESVDPVGAHERGLWGTGPDEQVHSAFSRVQGMLGHGGVLTAAASGGRILAERRTLTPWGDRPVTSRDPARPWPGALPALSPATVYELPRQITVEGADGRTVAVDDRGILSAPPATIVSGTGTRRTLTAWAGPWPLEQRWWDASAARSGHRFQVVDDAGEAWLLVLDEEGWWARGRYD